MVTIPGYIKPLLIIVWACCFRYADSLRQVLRVDDAAYLPLMEKPHLVNEKIVAFLKASCE
jgi:hypothetical protein